MRNLDEQLFLLAKACEPRGKMWRAIRGKARKLIAAEYSDPQVRQDVWAEWCKLAKVHE